MKNKEIHHLYVQIHFFPECKQLCTKVMILFPQDINYLILGRTERQKRLNLCFSTEQILWLSGLHLRIYQKP